MKNALRIALAVLCLYVASIINPVICLAGPAYSEPQEVEQPNGTLITIQRHGDEFFNWITVGDYVVLMDNGGVWRYAVSGGGGSSMPRSGGSSIYASDVAVEDQPPTNALTERELLESRTEFELALNTGFGLEESYSSAVEYSNEPYRESEKLLVLTVEFSDIKLQKSDNYWQNMFFGSTNSVNSFYLENSNNRFKFEPALGSEQSSVMRVSLSTPHPNTANATGAKNQELVTQALKAVDSSVNFKSFDENRDGYVSADELHIFLIIAGYEASYASNYPSVWAHRWAVSNSFDGVGVAYYMQAGEMLDSSNSLQIGIICHELGHDLGAPDLYNTTSSSDRYTPKYLSVMDIGSWGAVYGFAPGSSPVHFDPWCKTLLNFYKAGTVNPFGLDMMLTAPSNTAEYSVVKIPIAGSTEQYYLVEYRTQTGYDKGIARYYGEGIEGVVLWLIDEGIISYQNMRNVNNLPRKGVMWIEVGQNIPFMNPGDILTAAQNTYYANQTNYMDATKVSSGMILWADANTLGRVQIGSKRAGILDSPVNESNFDNVLAVSGWYLYTADAVTDSITSVEVHVGDTLAGYAERFERTDVEQAVKGYPDYSKCGFELKVNTAEYSSGQQVIKVRIMSGSEAVEEMTRTVYFGTDNLKDKLGYLDSPVEMQSFSDNIDIAGWYFYTIGSQPDSIASIDIFIDGVYSGSANRYERQDVVNAVHGFPEYNNCGFSLSVDASGIAGGNHILLVRVMGNDGSVVEEFYRNISVEKQSSKPFAGVMDYPVQGEAVTGSLDVTGWALYTKDGISDGIARIEVLLDGVAIEGQAKRSYRPDVEAAVPGYGYYLNCGYSKTVSLDGVSQGGHTISVLFYDEFDILIGAVSDRTIVVSPSAMPFLICLDSPTVGQDVANYLDIRGWALYSLDGERDGITEIHAVINGQEYQISRYMRYDVADAVGGYGDYSGCGYEAQIDISGLPAGEYTMLVSALGGDGSSAMWSVTVNLILPQ